MSIEKTKIEQRIKKILEQTTIESPSYFISSHSIPILKEGLDLSKQLNDENYIYLFHALIAYAANFSNMINLSLIEKLWCFENMTDEIFENTNPKYSFKDCNMKFLTLNLSKFITAFLSDSKVSKEHLLKLLDYSHNYQKRYGLNSRIHYSTKLRFIEYGILDEDIDECYFAWINKGPSVGEDCPACNMDKEIDYLLFKNDYEKALKKFEYMLERGYSCFYMPMSTYSSILIHTLINNDTKTGDLYNKVNYANIKNNNNFNNSIANHIIYTSYRNLKNAIPMFVDNITIIESYSDDHDKLKYSSCGYIFFRELYRDNQKSIKLILDKKSKIYNESNEYNVEELMNYYCKQMEDLNQAFDKRNGNNVISNNTCLYTDINLA